MIHDLFLFLEQHILPLGPLGVFIASLIEEIIAPIPSALIMLGSGFIFVKGSFSLMTILDVFYYVALPAALGVALGSLVVYGIARYIGVEILIRWGTFFGVTHSMVERAQIYFRESKKDDVAVFVARIIPVVPAVVIALGAGLIKMPVVRYLVISGVGTFIRASILGLIGWKVGAVYVEYAEIIGRWEDYILVGILVIVIAGLVYARYTHKQT